MNEMEMEPSSISAAFETKYNVEWKDLARWRRYEGISQRKRYSINRDTD